MWSCRFQEGDWSPLSLILGGVQEWELKAITDEEAMVELI